MIYHNTVQKHSKTSADEYRQAEENMITTSNQSQSMQNICTIITPFITVKGIRIYGMNSLR